MPAGDGGVGERVVVQLALAGGKRQWLEPVRAREQKRHRAPTLELPGRGGGGCLHKSTTIEITVPVFVLKKKWKPPVL